MKEKMEVAEKETVFDVVVAVDVGMLGNVRVGRSVDLDTLKEPPERCGIGYVGGVGLVRTATKHATNAATNVSDYLARITRFRKDI